ncbi:MAG: toll/interleukin-1 receptor domain-containing protein [Lachnospiraceae bacterium]|nr:toll/interleukin-1 receptor domain-containing protein [Lachnospiraceae bacterium]
MDKEVFISHSKEDKTIADAVCSFLENEGINCWIAPRDIPYGNDWAGEITNAIEKSKVFIFLFSKNSNMSRQCPKEINIADSLGIPIVCLAIERIEMNPTLKYHLSMGQFMYVNVSALKSYENNIVTTVKGKLENPHEIIFNLDYEMEKNFEELFGDNTQEDKEEIDEFRKLLNQKISNNYMKLFKDNNLYRNQKELPKMCDEEVEEHEKHIESTETYDERKVSPEGTHFPIIDEEGYITVIYGIWKTYDISDFTYYFTAKRLETFKEKLPDGKTKSLFYIDSLSEDIQLYIVTFCKSQDTAIINNGIYDVKENVVIITTHPIVVHIYSDWTYSGNDKIKVMGNDESSVIMLDPETGDEIPRKKYIDETGEERTIIELIAHKSYFAFSIWDTSPDCYRNKMNAEDIGDFYMSGVQGILPQNTYNALVWYEKSKTAQAYKKMADIFKNDPIFADEEFAKKYEQLYSKEFEDDETNYDID